MEKPRPESLPPSVRVGAAGSWPWQVGPHDAVRAQGGGPAASQLALVNTLGLLLSPGAYLPTRLDRGRGGAAGVWLSGGSLWERMALDSIIVPRLTCPGLSFLIRKGE